MTANEFFAAFSSPAGLLLAIGNILATRRSFMIAYKINTEDKKWSNGTK
jgi:hypothetical protein